MATAIREQDTLAALRGAVHLAVYKNGKLLFEETDHNLIVTTGREKLVRLLGGDYTNRITKVGVGTGSTPASDTDTGLKDAVIIPVQSTEYAGTKVRFNFTLGNADANGLLIRELGLFFADDVMFSRRVRKSIIGKEDDISITGYWEIYKEAIMGKLKETAQWENDIYQIEVTDPALGGESGSVNTAPRQLANRTLYLKAHMDSAENEIRQACGGKRSLAERINELEGATAQGDFSFAGTHGQTVMHNLGHTNYVVNVSATADTGGDMGDVYISRAANAFTVYNTGGYRGGARY